MGKSRIQEAVEIRASSWGSLFDCAYGWEGVHILGMRKASGLRATLGTAIHAGTAAFDLARMEGNAISADDAAQDLIDTLYRPTEEVDYKQDPSLSLDAAERIGLTLHTRYCHEISPLFQFKAVEMKLEPFDIECDGITIRLKGTMDRARVAQAEGGVVIPDIKSGGRLIDSKTGEVSIKGRSAQLGAYQLMYEHTTDEPTVGGQILALQTTNTPVAGVSQVFDAKRRMVGTDTAPGFIELAAQMLKTGLFPPNPQSPLCSEKYCARWATCMYHE